MMMPRHLMLRCVQAPLAPESSTGQFLNYILASEPQLFEDAMTEQLTYAPSLPPSQVLASLPSTRHGRGTDTRSLVAPDPPVVRSSTPYRPHVAG